MIIEFEKLITFHAEVDDEQFKDESGNINENLIIAYCESIDSTDDEHCWIYSDELKNITWKKSENEKEHKITESEYNHYREEREHAEHCYECSGYGDDYDNEGNCNCDDCSFNSDNYEKFNQNKIPIEINSQEFIQGFCDKIVEFYEGYGDRQNIIDKIKKLIDDTKFSYLEINSSNRIFLFAEHPTEFIKDNYLWNYLQNWVIEKYNTLMAIGMYFPNCVDLLNDDSVVSIFNITDYIR